jgi:hypothetical protein
MQAANHQYLATVQVFSTNLVIHPMGWVAMMVGWVAKLVGWVAKLVLGWVAKLVARPLATAAL